MPFFRACSVVVLEVLLPVLVSWCVLGPSSNFLCVGSGVGVHSSGGGLGVSFVNSAC